MQVRGLVHINNSESHIQRTRAEKLRINKRRINTNIFKEAEVTNNKGFTINNFWIVF